MIFFPTVDEDFQYFRSQGYTGSLNDMHYKAMGDLGYTGALSDRIHAFLTFKYGSFYEAMRDLRNGTSVFSLLSAYSVNGLDPALVFDFVGNYFRKGSEDSTLAAAVTHSRASSATMVNSSGVLVTVGNNVPRVGHHIYNGSAWVNEGVLHESEARTNLLLNSGTLSTQSATVAAAPNTLSFTGTGTVTLTGASTAGPLVGTGTGENNRVVLTFTPTAGTLTLTVSGTVTNAQLELGSTPSSYIPTAGATVTRAAETLTVPAANMPWPTPVVIGPELSSDTWAVAPSYDNTVTSISASAFSSVYNTTQNRVYVVVNTVVGGIYNFTATKTSGGDAAAYVREGALANGTIILSSLSEDDHSLTFKATTSTTSILFVNTNSDYAYEDISVKEINPLSVSIQMDGRTTYADEDNTANVQFLLWGTTFSANTIWNYLGTQTTATGQYKFRQFDPSNVSDIVEGDTNVSSPDILVPFNIASRHGSTFINGAVNGTALTANTTPVALPDLSATDFEIGRTFMGTIGGLRVWADDLGDTGIVEASAPSTEPSLSLTFDGSETSFTVSDWSE